MLDFEDVLLATAGMIESEPSVAMHVRESYRHFVVDEYQDVSPAQQQLLDLWLGGRRDLCVVGDASQTIYSFAGASPEYLLGFERRYADATVVRLERNYRSTPEIVDTANRLMRGRAGALQLERGRRGIRCAGGCRGALDRRRHGCRADAPAPRDGAAAPRRRTHRAPSSSSSIRRRARRGARRRDAHPRARSTRACRPRRSPCCMRVNSQSAMLEQRARRGRRAARGCAAPQRFFDRPEVREAVHALRAAALADRGRAALQVGERRAALARLDGAAARRARARCARAGSRSTRSPASSTTRPTGTTFRAFADDLRARAEAQHEPTVSAVTLATLHSAKGLEWDEVHLVGLTEGMLPIAYAKGFDAIDEERRLLYVGITRARRRLTLSWPRRGRRASRRTGAVAVPPGARHPHSGCGACRSRRGESAGRSR